MNTDWGVVRRDAMMPPTKQCLICDKLENPNANMVHNAGWLCPECKNRLKRVLYPKEGE